MKNGICCKCGATAVHWKTQERHFAMRLTRSRHSRCFRVRGDRRLRSGRHRPRPTARFFRRRDAGDRFRAARPRPARMSHGDMRRMAGTGLHGDTRNGEARRRRVFREQQLTRGDSGVLELADLTSADQFHPGLLYTDRPGATSILCIRHESGPWDEPFSMTMDYALSVASVFCHGLKPSAGEDDDRKRCSCRHCRSARHAAAIGSSVPPHRWIPASSKRGCKLVESIAVIHITQRQAH